MLKAYNMKGLSLISALIILLMHSHGALALQLPGPLAETDWLVDTRSLGFYLGAQKKSYLRRKGHIPGAKVFPDELLTTADPPVRFTDAEELRQLAEELGIDTRKNLITYCNSGQLASGSWFLFSELLGNSNASLYDGCMHQWSVEKRPVVIRKME